MLIDKRRVDTPELDAFHDIIEVRTKHLRLLRVRSRGVVADFKLLSTAVPITFSDQRSGATILFDGGGRFDERGRTGFFGPGSLTLNNQSLRGTEAYAGAPCSYVVFEWDPIHGKRFDGSFAIERLSRLDLARIATAVEALDGSEPTRAIAVTVDVLRGAGLGLERVDAREIAGQSESVADQRLQSAISKLLSSLHDLPTIEDLAGTLGWNERRIHRRFAELASRYRLPSGHWREAAHRARLAQATRLLAAPRASTDIVARLTGFRSASALCHAFAKAGLPSPGRLAAAAHRGALARWPELVPETGT